MILPGDILVSYKSTSWISNAILWAERFGSDCPDDAGGFAGEWGSHAMIGVAEGKFLSVEPWFAKVRDEDELAGYGEVRVYRVHRLAWPGTDRSLVLNPAVRNALGRAARGYAGRFYGFGKIALHALGLRRLCLLDGFPICSWSVAMPFKEAMAWSGWPLPDGHQVDAKAVEPSELDWWARQPNLGSLVERIV